MPWTADSPVWLIRFVGIVEILGVHGLILPAALRIMPNLTILAANGFVLVMVLVMGLHIIRGEYSALGLNIFLLLLSGFIVWGRTKKAVFNPKNKAEVKGY